MKSFQLYWPPPDPIPARVVKDYKPHELEQFRELFRPYANGYRWRRRIAFAAAAGFALSLLMGLVSNQPQLAFAGGILCWFVGVITIATGQPIECPACKGDLDRCKRYCPECGSSKLDCASRWEPPHCCSCGKQLRRGKYSNYKMRHCTHCGILLDEQGI